MTLHRDVHWVGRQWAVTGYGIQACDQKQKSKFDVEACRIWEDGLLENLRDQPWFNSEDFGKALAVARTRFPEPPHKVPTPRESARRLAESPVNGGLGESLEKSILNPTDAQHPKLSQTGSGPERPRVSKAATQQFEMRIGSWPAKFVSQWRVRIRR